MKNLFKLFVPVAAAAIALVSCQPKEEQIGNNPAGEVTIRVHANAQAIAGEDTKTYIDTYQGTANTILWGTDEYMKLALTAGENDPVFATSTDASANLFYGEPEALFEFSVNPATASEYVYQGLYPASAAATSNNTNAANYKVNLPAIQNATASSYDPAAYILVAKPETFDAVQTDWEVYFRRATALNKITLKNFASSVEINKVKITAEGKHLAGGHHINLTTGDNCEGSTEYYNSEATIEVLYATPLTGTSMDVWFTSWDTEIAEGEKLTIIAYTTDNKCYTKEITVPTGKTIKFQEGYLNTLGAKFDGITPENVATISGEFVILASINAGVFAMKGEANGSRIGEAEYTGNTTSYSGDASIIWTITPVGSSYTIKNGSNYLGWNGGTGNAANNAALIAEDEYDADKCLMDIQETNGVYTISVHAEPTRILARNSTATNHYFAFYGGTQAKELTLVPATVDNRTPVTLSFAEDAINKTTANYSEFTGQAVTADPNVSAITSNITYEISGDDIGSISGSTVTLNGNAGAATVTASFPGDDTYGAATASYTITVTVPITIQTVTVAEFLAAAESSTNWYRLTGTISDITSTTYGNFTLTDATGAVYVYGLTATEQASNDKSFASLNLEEGFTVTIVAHRSSHNSNPQAGGAYYESHTAPASLTVSPTALVFSADGESKTVSATATNFSGDVTITASSNNAQFTTVVTGTTITVTAAANQSSSSINGTVTITATDGVDTKTSEVSVSQSASVSPAQNGDILWQEDFTGYGTTMPTTATGTHVYGAGTVSYLLTNGGVTTALNDGQQYSGGASAPELLVSKSNGAFTISGIPTGLATSMTLTFKSNHGDYCTVSSGTTGITVGTPTVSSGVVTTTITATSGVSSFDLVITNTNSSNTRVDDFVLVVGVPPVTLESISVSGQKTSFTVGDTFSFGGVVTANYSNGSSADVTSSASFTGYDMSSTGSQTVTVSYIEGSVTKTTTYAINVNAAGGSPKTYSYTITTSAFTATGYGKEMNDIVATATDGSGATLTVSHATNNAGLQSGKIQFKKNAGMLYNTTDLGTVDSVVLTGASGGTGTVYKGSTQNPTSSGSGGYFTIKETANGTLTCTSITVTFTK